MASNYWEDLYQKKGVSGSGSVGYLKAWKWARIGQLHEVLDYGCGDLSFWEGLYEAPGDVNYIGVDVSPTIITKDMRTRPAWTFYTVEEWRRFEGIQNKRDTTLCLDVLFHILAEAEYRRVLETLFSMAKRRVVIYTWRFNPFSRDHALSQVKRGILSLEAWRVRAWLRYVLAPSDGDGVYQKWRGLGSIFEVAHSWGFFLRRASEAPDGIGVLLDFRRVEDESDG